MATGQSIVMAVALAAAGCSQLDPHAGAWRRVALGDTRTSVEQAMGPPSAIHTLELPMLQLEQLTWKAVGGRTYLVHFALGHAAAKVVLD
jgi:hypothetical protein